MQISEIRVDGYEKVVRCTDQTSGLHALIAVHEKYGIVGMRLILSNV